jgi:hypothetical protein
MAPVEVSKHFRLGAEVTTYTRAPSALSAPAVYTNPPTGVLQAATLEPFAHFWKFEACVCPPYSAPSGPMMASRSGEPAAEVIVNTACAPAVLPCIIYTFVPAIPHVTVCAT